LAKRILMEEFHLTVLAPRGLPQAEYDAMRQTLDDPRFHAQLRRAVRRVARRHRTLGKAKVLLSWYARRPWRPKPRGSERPAVDLLRWRPLDSSTCWAPGGRHL
jgi:hypothetical protein